MRHLTHTTALICALGFSGAAHAITQTTDIPLVDNGLSLKTSTVTLTFKKPKLQQRVTEHKKIEKPKVVVRLKRRTNESGHLIVQTDDRIVRKDTGMTVDVSIVTDEGRTYVLTDVPLETLFNGQPLNVAPGPVPVPVSDVPPGQPVPSWSGPYLGGELIKNSGRVHTTERLESTGEITNVFNDSGDPLGAGAVIGYDVRMWSNNVVVGAFGSFDFLNQKIRHNFGGGQFLGTSTNWFMTLGGRVGVIANPQLLVFGLAGVSFLNHDLDVNFSTAASNNVTTPGFTLGLGFDFSPAAWSIAGHPLSVFGQYQHTWWDTAKFNSPSSSPAYNYAFRREDDTFKIGVNVRMSP